MAAAVSPVPSPKPARGMAPAIDTSPFCLPPDAECPDCQSPAGMWCFAWCPRYAEDPDRAFEDAQAGEHPDGF